MEPQTKILVVEDNAIVAADIKSRVQKLGFSVTGCVSRGESAVQSVESVPPNLILMDIKLKGEMSGIEAASIIREKHDIPIIYLTSYTDETTLDKAKKTDPFGYVIKPFEDKELNTVIEISLHKHKVERELKKSQQWLHTTLKSIGDGVITTDMDGLVTFINPVAEELTGWQFKDAAGQPVTTVFNIVNEQTQEVVENPVTKVLESGQIVGLANHTLLIDRNGHRRPIKDSGAPILLNDTESIGVVLIFQDDTESRTYQKQLEEKEERFRRLFEHAPLPYQSLDENGCFLEVNRTWLEIMGYKKAEVIGEKFADFLHPDWQNHFKENFPRFKSIGEILGVEFEMKRSDGTFITVQFDGKTSNDQTGNFIQTHCVFRDITKEAELQELLTEQEKILRKNQKLEAIGTLAGGIAHDFNNILSAIIGFTELSLDEVGQETVLHDNLQEVLSASGRAKELVKQILTYSRQGEEEKKPLAVDSLLREAISMLRSTIPSNIVINDQKLENGIRINASGTQLHQVFVNLITNAVHAISASGTIEVILCIENIKGPTAGSIPNIIPGEYAKISVIDSGCGISNKNLETIFDPYFTTKSPDKGSGLGLSVVHGIIKSHGGHILVSSKVDIGTTVDIWLPTCSRMVETMTVLQPEENLPAGSERILVIDDEPSIVRILQRNLENAGYKVKCCTDSVEAIETFRSTPESYDLVLTDMTMPTMSGLKLAKEIKAINTKIPIILCTGYSEGIDINGNLPKDLDGILMKPLDKVQLLSTIRDLLN